jgi:hypothetical protein
MVEYQLAVLTATLKKLGVRYTVYGNTLIAKPYPEQEAFTPGTPIMREDGMEHRLDITTFDLIEWITFNITNNTK